MFAWEASTELLQLPLEQALRFGPYSLPTAPLSGHPLTNEAPALHGRFGNIDLGGELDFPEQRAKREQPFAALANFFLFLSFFFCVAPPTQS